VFGAALAYVTGIRLARQTSCSRKPWLRRFAEYINRQACSPEGLFGHFLGTIWRFEHRRVNDRTLALLGIEPGQDVLELGCGSGSALAEAIERAAGARVLGLDVSATMVAMATRRNRAAVARGTASIRQIDGVNLGLEPASIDRIFSVHTLYFWKNPPEILRQLRETLRGKGRFVLTFRPEAPGIPERFRDPTYRFYSEAELEELLQEAGFTDVQLIRDESIVYAVASTLAAASVAS
jgi:SAM-dependent methyltransferase